MHQKWRKGAQPCCFAQPDCQMLWKASWEYYQPTVKQESLISVSSNKWMTCTAEATTALCTGYTKADTRWRPEHGLISPACTVAEFQAWGLNEGFSQTAGNCCIDFQWCANSPQPIHHLNAWMEREQCADLLQGTFTRTGGNTLKSLWQSLKQQNANVT